MVNIALGGEEDTMGVGVTAPQDWGKSRRCPEIARGVGTFE